MAPPPGHQRVLLAVVRESSTIADDLLAYDSSLDFYGCKFWIDVPCWLFQHGTCSSRGVRIPLYVGVSPRNSMSDDEHVGNKGGIAPPATARVKTTQCAAPSVESVARSK